MEYIVLNNYLYSIKKREKTSFVDMLKKLDFSHKVAFILLIILTSVAMVCYFFNKVLPVPILMLSDILIALYINISQNRKDIEKSTQKIEERDAYYEKIKKWLEQINFAKKNQIKQLCNRCEKIIEKKERKKEETKKLVDKIFTVFIFPVWLTLISSIFGLSENIMDEYIKLINLIAFLIVLIYLCIRYCVDQFGVSGKIKYDMQGMVNDLYGVLDRKFDIEESDIK